MLLVGTETSDDAAVYKINEELAMIQTVDFFTPVVDDPCLFGQIAAANALSDVYAMGGEPKVALNLAAFPGCLDIEILGEILKMCIRDRLKTAACCLFADKNDLRNSRISDTRISCCFFYLFFYIAVMKFCYYNKRKFL